MNRNPIFIHAMFRTGSTYLWNKFRNIGIFYSYYEPFNNILQSITEKELIKFNSTLATDIMSHPDINNTYFNEYGSLLKENSMGVPFFKKSFIADNFCEVTNTDDQKKYIDNLVKQAHKKISLFQFNRAVFQICWYKKHYPNSFNIYLVRDPRDNWESMVSFLKKDNDFFITMYLLSCSINKSNKIITNLSNMVPLIEYHNNDFTKEFHFYRSILESYEYSELYLIFYYTWLRALITNTLHTDLVIDIDLLSNDYQYRKNILALLRDIGFNALNFQDVNIKTYKDYTLSEKVMDDIEADIQKIHFSSLSKSEMKLFINNLDVNNLRFFNIHDIDRMIKKKPYIYPNLDLQMRHEQIIQGLFEKYSGCIDDLNLKLLDKLLDIDKLTEDLKKKDEYIYQLLSSNSYLVGKKLLSSLRFFKKLFRR